MKSLLAGAAGSERRNRLHRFVARRLPDRHDAEDVVQDVLLKAHSSLHQLRDAERLDAWLARMATHRIIDLHRARRPTVELPDDLAAAVSDEDPVIALAPCLPAMIDRLPDADRAPLQLAELQGLTQGEVARRLGLSLSGAKSRVQRARVRLRELVERCCRVWMSGRTIGGFEPRRACRCAPCDRSGESLRPLDREAVNVGRATFGPLTP
jgi:RNA polymerase sigma-70 factor (ECF subfamily)